MRHLEKEFILDILALNENEELKWLVQTSEVSLWKFENWKVNALKVDVQIETEEITFKKWFGLSLIQAIRVPFTKENLAFYLMQYLNIDEKQAEEIKVETVVEAAEDFINKWAFKLVNGNAIFHRNFAPFTPVKWGYIKSQFDRDKSTIYYLPDLKVMDCSYLELNYEFASLVDYDIVSKVLDIWTMTRNEISNLKERAEKINDEEVPF